MNHATPARFHELCRRVGVAEELAGKAFADLASLYAEEHRKYHNLSHIDRMLGWLDATGERNDSVELAIWFHDAVYDPLGKDNEAKSARYFTEHFGSSVSAPLKDDVERLILATDASRPRSGREDENLIIDIDLSILGASPEDYAAYRDAIRCEYAAVPEGKFIAGRAAILRRFLSQRIYTTGYFAKLEGQARMNILEEIESLESTKF
jgi:predicted metal-dependent HD superfamily phosphohydrolase